MLWDMDGEPSGNPLAGLGALLEVLVFLEDALELPYDSSER